jgi:hypothetical protein
MQMPGMAPAVEGPAPYYSTPGPDQQPQDLEGGLAMVESILFRDGGMDQNEQRVFSAWVQKIIVMAEAAQQQGAQGPGQQAGLGQSSVSEYNPMGGAGSSPVPELTTNY